MGYYKVKKVISLVVMLALVSQAWLVLGNTEIRVTMWNNVEASQDMKVHCKSEGGSDFGVWSLPYHQTYEFKFSDAGIQDDFHCSFDIDGTIHWLDMYLAKRDRDVCGINKQLCRWVIQQFGACLIDSGSCYNWDHDRHGSEIIS